MDSKFSPRVKDVLSFSKDEAERLGNSAIGTEHLFLGILREGEGVAINILSSLGINLLDIKHDLEFKLQNTNLDRLEQEDIPLQKSAERVLKLIYLEAKALKNQTIDTSHLLLAILKDEKCLVTRYLDAKNIDYNAVKNNISASLPKAQADFPSEDREGAGGMHGNKPKPVVPGKSNTPVLDNFGVDITQSAEEGTLDPIVGREVEIERLAQILSRRKKNNPILIGEPGVGKSAIVEGLALRIIQRKVSRVLFDKRVVTLDLASIVAGTKYRGQFEERMKAILNELAKTTDIILFIDEIHTIVGAGGATGSLDAANMLKPALARGEIQCIGATTLDEYRQNIEKDGALERRFQKILVEPTSVEETISILNNIKEKYEDHHNVFYTPEAINACVKLTTRYISDRHLPDKAIDALDEAGSRVHISNILVPKIIEELEENIEETRQNKIKSVKAQKFELAASFRDKEKQLMDELENEKEKWEKDLSSQKEKVSEDNIAEVVAMMTGVPVRRIAQAEGTRLLQMNKELSSRVIGQDDAIAKIVKAIQRNRAGLKDPSKPIGSFIFLGPTGVGKTQLAKVLSEYLFDSSEALIRIDMSEYMEKFAVSRLVGAPPGYVGYEEGGQLTEKVRRKPYSVILLDEIEKAHPDIFNILLQLLDDGQLTDSLGRKVDFKNCIVIMTSNIGSRELKDFGKGIGFQSKSSGDSDYASSIIQKALRKAFAPEFINRVDDLIMFNSLSEEHIHQIIDIELKGLYSRVEDLGFKIKISTSAKDFIVKKGYDVQFGARPLKRAIQKYLEDEMAEVIIRASLTEGDTISVGLDKTKGKITTKILKQNKEVE
jgi:ATP-dependent Clp protease ATP-binding subunit ClpC